MWRVHALAVAVAVLAIPAAAHAGSVEVVEYSVDDSSVCSRVPGACDFARVVYRAGAGERNDVVLSGSAEEIVVRDAGASLEVGAGCEPIGAREARCDSARRIFELVADAGDQGDRVENATALDIRVKGGSGDDLLVGGKVGDTLYAGPGRDRLFGRGGDDHLHEGTGGDAAEADVMDGGEGGDTVSYRTRTRRVRVNLADPRFSAGEAGEGDRLRDIDYAGGGRGNDLLLGSSGDDSLSGGGGRDRIYGGDGEDYLDGDSGDDKLHGGAGTDSLDGGRDDDALVGGCGEDTLYGASGSDRMYAADGRRDEVFGGPGSDVARIDPRIDLLNEVESRRRARARGGCNR